MRTILPKSKKYFILILMKEQMFVFVLQLNFALLLKGCVFNLNGEQVCVPDLELGL